MKKWVEWSQQEQSISKNQNGKFKGGFEPNIYEFRRTEAGR